MTSIRPLVLFFSLLAATAHGDPGADPVADPATAQRPLVQVDVSLQLTAIEHSVDQISRSFAQMATSLEQVAASGELTAPQQEEMDRIMRNLDHVVDTTRRSVDALPAVVQRTRETVQTNADQWLADLRFWFFVVAGVIALVLVIVLAAFYGFTVRPLQHTVLRAVGDISGMARAMATTAETLEVINRTHREVLRLAGAATGDPAVDRDPTGA